jgi:hypothetical protein
VVSYFLRYFSSTSTEQISPIPPDLSAVSIRLALLFFAARRDDSSAGTQAALVAYAEQNGLTCLMESFAKWRGRLSPEQYDVVEVRTNRGLKSAMLLPKAVLKAAWETDPLRKALIPERDSACFRRKRHHVG